MRWVRFVLNLVILLPRSGFINPVRFLFPTQFTEPDPHVE